MIRVTERATSICYSFLVMRVFAWCFREISVKKILLGACAFLAIGAFSAVHAAELVVVEARGVQLQPGAKIDGAKVFSLEAGQRVTLISSDGKTLRLRGPYNAAPAAGDVADGSGVVDSLKSMVSSKQAGTATLGVVRSGAAGPELPDPWLINVMRSGARCILDGEQVVFWKPAASPEAIAFSLQPSEGGWTAASKWPANSDRMGMPKTLPLKDGQSYAFEAGGQSNTLTFHTVPKAIEAPRMRAAYMMEKGCEEQATALMKITP